MDDPILVAAVLCFLLGVVLGGLSRLAGGRALASLVVPAVFLAGYVATYQQVPTFPPIGSVNKIFYIGVAATMVGLALDLAPATPRLLHRGLEVVLPVLIAGWIALPRLSSPDPALVATILALWIGGAAVLWRLDTAGSIGAPQGTGKVVERAAEAADGSGLVAIAMLMAIALGFAPVALAGASSTSLMLCVALVAGWGAAALWELIVPRGAFAASALLGGAGGLLAVIDTVVLITRHADMLALALLLPVLVCGQLGARLLLPSQVRGRLRQVLVALMAAAPVPVVVAVLLLRHPDAFAT